MRRSLSDAVEKARLGPAPDSGLLGDSVGRSKTGRSYAIYLRVPYETRRALKQLAIDTDSTSQDLMKEALDDLFIKYGRKPL